MELVTRGGFGRVGFQNCVTFQHNGLTVMVDCGAGISLHDAIEQGPNFRGLNPNNLVVLLSHGHNDHVSGAVKLDKYFHDSCINFYGSPFTLGRTMALAERETGKDKDKEYFWRWQRNAVEPFHTERLGNDGDCQITSFSVEHSILDARGWSIFMDGKHIVHLGDLKHLPQESADYILRQGPVDYLFLDSTGAWDKGPTVEESEFDRLIEPPIASSNKTNSRLIIVGFSTNIPRWMKVIDLAAKYGKKVGFLGSSLNQTMELARNYTGINYITGYSSWDSTAVDLADCDIILCTGCQGEYKAGLWRFAHGLNDLRRGDQIVISSRLLPDNEYNLELLVKKIKENFKDAITIYRDSRVPSEYYADERGNYGPSGHACVNDLKRIINQVQPKVVVPIHGDPERRAALGEIAAEQGVAVVLVGDNAEVSI